jgi:hypothetical protein
MQYKKSLETIFSTNAKIINIYKTTAYKKQKKRLVGVLISINSLFNGFLITFLEDLEVFLNL